MREQLNQLARGPDYFASLGNAARVAAAIALAPFALLLAVMALFTPISVVMMALTGNGDLVPMALASGLLVTVLAIPLCWVTLRLFRGQKADNGLTVLPTWLVRAFLLTFLTPLSVGMAVGAANLAWQAVEQGSWSLAGYSLVMGCGFIVGVLRGLLVAFRLGKHRSEENTSNR